jgi:hypothetical protein
MQDDQTKVDASDDTVVETEVKTDVDAGADDKGGEKPAAKQDAKGESVLDDLKEGDEEPKKVVAPADWPEDWREKSVAHITDKGDREKELTRLKRIKSPQEMYKSYRALERQVQSDYIRKPPEGASEKEIAEWRKEIGVPPKPDGYELPKLEGHEWTDADKPMLDLFLGKMHGENASQAQINASLGAYAELVSSVKEQEYNTDKGDDEVCVDALRSEWGHEYRTHQSNVKNWLNNAEKCPPELAAALRDARTPDGHRLIYNPEIWKILAPIAQDSLGASAHVPGGDGKTLDAISTRKEEIKKVMKTDMNRYWQEGLDKEYQSLLAQEESAGKRGRAA